MTLQLGTDVATSLFEGHEDPNLWLELANAFHSKTWNTRNIDTSAFLYRTLRKVIVLLNRCSKHTLYGFAVDSFTACCQRSTEAQSPMRLWSEDLGETEIKRKGAWCWANELTGNNFPLPVTTPQSINKKTKWEGPKPETVFHLWRRHIILLNICLISLLNICSLGTALVPSRFPEQDRDNSKVRIST